MKAIRQLGDEVSSAAWSKSHDSADGVVWVASGRKVCNDHIGPQITFSDMKVATRHMHLT